MINYKYKGEYYRNLIKWIFGDRELLPAADDALALSALETMPGTEQADMTDWAKKSYEFWVQESKNRDGIKVVITK